MAERPRKRPSPGSADAARRRAIAGRKQRGGEAESAPRPEPSANEPMRLNRFLARAGMASRRDADVMIEAGRVTVNGETVTELGLKVGPGDRVELDGRAVTPRGPVYILLNKPKDTITTTDDEKGRSTVMALMEGLPREDLAGLFPVGRLDRDTTGALLLTNDGDLAHHLMHPRYQVEKLYVARLSRAITAAELEQLHTGVTLDDGRAAADQVAFVSEDRKEVALAIHEGRNRIVRRMFEALGAEVETLHRVRYAGLTLDGLRRGRWRRLEGHEVNTLRRLVKLKPIIFEREPRETPGVPSRPGTGRPGTGRPGSGRPSSGRPGPGRSGGGRAGPAGPPPPPRPPGGPGGPRKRRP